MYNANMTADWLGTRLNLWHECCLHSCCSRRLPVTQLEREMHPLCRVCFKSLIFSPKPVNLCNHTRFTEYTHTHIQNSQKKQILTCLLCVLLLGPGVWGTQNLKGERAGGRARGGGWGGAGVENERNKGVVGCTLFGGRWLNVSVCTTATDNRRPTTVHSCRNTCLTPWINGWGVGGWGRGR